MNFGSGGWKAVELISSPLVIGGLLARPAWQRAALLEVTPGERKVLPEKVGGCPVIKIPIVLEPWVLKRG